MLCCLKRLRRFFPSISRSEQFVVALSLSLSHAFRLSHWLAKELITAFIKRTSLIPLKQNENKMRTTTERLNVFRKNIQIQFHAAPIFPTIFTSCSPARTHH